MATVPPYFIYTVDMVAYCLASDGAGNWASHQVADLSAYDRISILIQGSDYDDSNGAIVVALRANMTPPAQGTHVVSWKYASYNGGATWSATLAQEPDNEPAPDYDHETTSLRYQHGAFYFLDQRRVPGSSDYVLDVWRGTGGANWGLLYEAWRGALVDRPSKISITYGGETWEYGSVYPTPADRVLGRDGSYGGNMVESGEQLLFYIDGELVHTLNVGPFVATSYWCGGYLGAAPAAGRRYAYFF